MHATRPAPNPAPNPPPPTHCQAYAEGGFALAMRAAALHGVAAGGDAAAGELLDAMVELVKSWPSEWCLEANKWAIQVLSGGSWVVDWAVPTITTIRPNK